MRLVDAYAEIQACILAGHGSRASYHFLAIDDAAAFRAALPGLARRVTTEEERRRHAPEAVVGLGVTHRGLATLGLPASVRAELPDAFADGMAERADLIGDAGPSDPLRWEAPFGTGAVDLAIWIWADAEACLETTWRALCEGGDAPAGCVRIGSCPGEVLLDRSHGYRVEPFGFRDGISQPHVDRGEKTRDGVPRLAPGEFVLGYPSEADRDLPGTRPPPQGAAALARAIEHNGSYMVFRKIQQYPERLEAFLRDNGTDPRGRALLEAEMMGRWPGGAVLRREDEDPGPSDENDFRYGDPDVRSPRGCHIRRAHPRDDRPDGIAARHRILRRGIPYAQDGEVGLLFVCFNARIDDQFELIQSRWLNGGNASGFPSDRVDAIAGSADGVRVVLRTDGKRVELPEPLTRVRGGEYLLVPSREALLRLSRTFEPDPPQPAAEEPELFEPTPELVARCLRGAPVSRPIADTRERVWFVGTHAGVRSVLEDGASFTIDPYRQRVKAALGDLLLISTSDHVPDEAPIRRDRAALLQRVFGPRDRAIVEGIARGVLSRIGPGLHEVVDEIARLVPLSVAEHYIGVADTGNEPSPTAIAAHFGTTPPEQVPPAWAARRVDEVRRSGVGIGRHNLAFWTRILFLETFVNLYEAREPKRFAHEAAREFTEHLQSLAEAPRPNTVLAQAASTDPHLAVLLAFELAVGGTDTVTLAVTNLLDLLLARPEAMQAARAAVRERADDDRLDRLIVECLRLSPPAGLLLRRCGPAGATLERQRIEPGALVAALTAAACLDPRVFGPDPTRFDPSRDPDLAPVFGAGAHACAGRWLALAQLREVLRFVFGPAESEGPPRFRRLRRAAGPGGRKRTRLRLPTSLYVWLDA